MDHDGSAIAWSQRIPVAFYSIAKPTAEETEFFFR